MLTILEAIELSSDYLLKKGVNSPRINAELLLAEILHCKRMDLYLRFDQPISEDEKKKYRIFIRRRGEREPLQYIIGKVDFYGFEFLVSRDVLIPRQETELLVENVILEAKSRANVSILEVGTGSGNITVSLLKNIENSKVHSIDISIDAVKLAFKNAEIHGVNGRLRLENISFDDLTIHDGEKFDYIVSNPPYISLREYDNLEPELLNFEPKIALTDGEDGLKFYRSISSRACEFLNSGGKLFFEIGHGKSQNITEIMIGDGFSNLQVIKDYQNIDRVISGELS